MKNLVLFLLTLGFAAQALPVSNLRPAKLSRKASFEETLERFPSPYGVIQQFNYIVPNGLEAQYTWDDCMKIGEKSAPVTGVMDPLQQSALEDTPGALFYPYYEACVRKLVSSAFASTSAVEANEIAIFGEDFAKEITALRESQCSGYLGRPYYCGYSTEYRKSLFWSEKLETFKPELQQKFMLSFIRYLGGPDAVLRRLKLIGSDETFGVKISSADELAQFLVLEMLKLKNGDKPYSLLDVYAETAILLRLGPALKH